MNYADRVKDTTTTTGTGTVTLSNSAATGFRTFGSAFSTGTAQIPYCIVGGAEWETGIGTLATGTTLSRDTVYASSNGGSLVNFSAGTKDVFCTLASSQIAKFLTVDDVAFSQTIPLNTGGTRYMTQSAVSGALTFAAASSPVRGSLVYLRLTANGTNTPDFSAFREWGGSLGWDNTSGIVNQVQFFYDGVDAWYSVSQEVGATPSTAATAITLTGPSSGIVSTASSNFTVGVSPSTGTISGTVVVTPAAVGGGTFSPTSISLTNSSKTGTFTYTPASTGTKTISVTNDGGLTNPSSITYTSNAAATVPGAPTIGTATAGNGTVSVAFSAPASDGGSAITGYTATLYKVSDNTSAGTATGSSSPISVTATNGVAVYAKVKATNSVGTGAESAASNNVTPAAPSSQQLRFSGLIGMTESGTGPYTYTGNGSGAFNGSPNGGIANLHLPASTDGWAELKITTLNSVLLGFSTSSTVTNYAGTDYYVFQQGSAGSTYQRGQGSTTGAVSTNATSAVGDIIRIERVGTTINIKLSTDNGSSYSTIHSFTGVSTGVYYVQAEITGTAVFTNPTGSASLV